MSQPLEELIRQRDELIEQLQGEWAIDSSLKSISRKGAWIGFRIFIAGVIFACVFTPLMFALEMIRGNVNIKISILDFAWVMFIMMVIFGVIGFLCVHIQSLWYRRFDPIRVEDSHLSWNKKKGHVFELLNLENLTGAYQFQDGGPGSSRLFVRLMGRSVGMYIKHMFISKGDHNTPRFTPVMFTDGEVLIEYLTEIAQINRSIKELNES